MFRLSNRGILSNKFGLNQLWTPPRPLQVEVSNESWTMKKSHGKPLYYTGPKFVTPISSSCVEFCLQKTKTMYLMPKHLLKKKPPCLHGTRGFKMTNPNTAPFQEKSFKISIYSICIVGCPQNGPKSQWPWKKIPQKMWAPSRQPSISRSSAKVDPLHWPRSNIPRFLTRSWSHAVGGMFSTFSVGLFFTSREQMPRSTPPFLGGCWGLWKWWEHCGNSSWIQAVLGGCLGNFLGGMVVFSLVMFCSLRWPGNRK